MEFFDLIEDEMDEFYEHISRPRRSPHIRPRTNYLDNLDEIDFRQRFRFSKTAVQYIFSLIEDRIKPNSMLNHAIPPMERLLLTLRYYATGSFLSTTGDFAGVGIASASRIIKVVSRAIAALRPDYVKFPNDYSELCQGFYKVAKFPNVVGALDCTHVRIRTLGGDVAEVFRNRKSVFSINVQCICGPNLKFLNIVARWPGSTHDQIIFDNSSIKQKFEGHEFGDFILLADSGYATTNYKLVPLTNPSTAVENLFNESQIRTRNIVERSFGVWKSRFPVLRRQIILSLENAQVIIVACSVLHNIAIDIKEANFLISSEDVHDITPIRDNGGDTTLSKYMSYFETLLETNMRS